MIICRSFFARTASQAMRVSLLRNTVTETLGKHISMHEGVGEVAAEDVCSNFRHLPDS
jgi:hypothetical protein